MYLAYSNISGGQYPTPWTMWAGPVKKPGDHVGNIKIGPAHLKCPEDYAVGVFFVPILML